MIIDFKVMPRLLDLLNSIQIEYNHFSPFTLIVCCNYGKKTLLCMLLLINVHNEEVYVFVCIVHMKYIMDTSSNYVIFFLLGSK